MSKLDLNVDDPRKVARVLRAAAQAFYDSAGELESNWQDKGAGRPWEKLGKILDSAADRCDTALKNF